MSILILSAHGLMSWQYWLLWITGGEILLEAVGTGTHETNGFAVLIQQVEASVESEEFFGYKGADEIEIVQGGIFLSQVKKGGKGLFLKALEVVKSIAFLLFPYSCAHTFHLVAVHLTPSVLISRAKIWVLRLASIQVRTYCFNHTIGAIMLLRFLSLARLASFIKLRGEEFKLKSRYVLCW